MIIECDYCNECGSSNLEKWTEGNPKEVIEYCECKDCKYIIFEKS